MIPRVITTAGPFWESELVERARVTGTLRVAPRALQPGHIHRALVVDRVPAVLVGAEIPWLSPGLISAWRHMGALVIGVSDPYHRRGERMLEEWGCHYVLDDPDPQQVAAIIGVAASPQLRDSLPARVPAVIAVGGPRGAPGRTEIAVALAWLARCRGSTLLVEADTSPALGLRLGISPPSRPYQLVAAHGMDLLLWSPRGSVVGMQQTAWSRLFDYETVVVDLGPDPARFDSWVGERVVVCRASPSGIVRAASLLARLGARPPVRTVVNRLGGGHSHHRMMNHLTAWAGRPPDAVIGELEDLRWGKPPPPSLTAPLRPLLESLAGVGGELGSYPVTAEHAQIADGHQGRIEHPGHSFGSRGVVEVHKEAVPPSLGSRTGFDPGEVGAPGG